LAFSFGPAQAQDEKVRVQMQSSFPPTLAILGPMAKRTAETITTITGGSVDVKFFDPGTLVPPAQAFDAVSSGALDSAWSAASFWTGKDIAFAFYSAVPFGPGPGEYLAWMKHGGGEELMEELYGKYNVHPVLCGLISPEASGWFREEIKTLDDLKGLKMRISGLGGNVMQKLGVATQLMQPGDIYQALQLGTIDATEYSMPAMDLSLSFYQVAKYYYFPGWHQQATFAEMIWNKDKWDSMSDTQRAQVETACESNITATLALSESSQFKALQEIESKGVNIMTWDQTFLDAFEAAWEEVVVEQSAASPEFKKAWDSLSAFRGDYDIWRERSSLD
jgi:TRAP-type mannitol/chloroaromatic compound transport system substrate-binding protein